MHVPPNTSSFADAELVYQTLYLVSSSIFLRNAVKNNFEKSESSLNSTLQFTFEELMADHFLSLSELQGEIDHYRTQKERADSVLPQLKSLNARLRTLQMQHRNIEQEQSKGGLFKSKLKQELLLKNQRIVTQINQVKDEKKTLELRQTKS